MGIFFENVIARQSFPFNNHPLKATLLHYKHFRKAVAFAFWKLELVDTAVSGRGHFEDFRPGFGKWHICHVDRHGQFTLKQLRLSLVNEMPTNFCTGPRLFV